jgi:hypothetical protein
MGPLPTFLSLYPLAILLAAMTARAWPRCSHLERIELLVCFALFVACELSRWLDVPKTRPTKRT